MTSPERLAEMLAYCEEAVEQDRDTREISEKVAALDTYRIRARTDFPAVIRELQEARAQLAEAEGLLKRWRLYGGVVDMTEQTLRDDTKAYLGGVAEHPEVRG
jgi:hypothetical protein